MAKLTFTGEQIDQTIRKVKSGYADISKVTANPDEVRNGRVFVDSNKIERQGTLVDGEAQSNLVVKNASYLSDDETNYPVSINQTNQVSKVGCLETPITGEMATKYIQTEERTITPEGSEQVITPHSGKLISKVTVNSIPDLKDKPLYRFPACGFDHYIYYYSSSSSNYTVAKIPSGTTHNNVYLKSGNSASDNVVYIVPLSMSSSSTTSLWATVYMVDSSTHRLKNGTIILSPGDSFVSESSNFSPAGTLTYTTAGRITFNFTEDFIAMNSSYEFCPLVLKKGTTYYAVVVDARRFTSGTSGGGTYATSKYYRYYSYGEDTIDTGYSCYDFAEPKQIIESYTNLYFRWRYSSSSNYDPPRLVCGSGTGMPLVIETKGIPAPVLSINGSILSFDAVEGATSYSITMKSASKTYTKTITTTMLDLSNVIFVEGEYEITAVALGEFGSDPSEPVTYVYVVKSEQIIDNSSFINEPTIAPPIIKE